MAQLTLAKQLPSILLCLVLCLVLGGTPLLAQERPAAAPEARRPTVGVAFGGGSARGIAHVGVIRWFEEHRIPIDVAAGTSMGGLIGGAFATGMDAAELDGMLQHMNWDEMFGASNFAFKNIRRKADAKAYPSRLEFGLKHGITSPVSSTTANRWTCSSAGLRPPTTAFRRSTTCRRRSGPWPWI